MKQDSQRKKRAKKLALESPFMRIPAMPIDTVIYLMECGYTDIFQLSGRSAESLFSEIQKHDFAVEAKTIMPALRLAIYFAENETQLDRNLLNLHAWE